MILCDNIKKDLSSRLFAAQKSTILAAAEDYLAF